MGERTIRTFTYKGDFWAVFESWAIDHNFELKQAGTNVRLYKKKGFNNVFMKAARSKDRARLEMYAKNDFGVEMAIHTRALPLAQGWKKKYKKEANKLLRSLKQKPIE